MPNDTREPKAVFGQPSLVHGLRAFGEMQAGRPLIIADGDARVTVMPVEGLTPERLDLFRRRVAGGPISLVVTGRRAERLGLEPHPATTMAVADTTTSRDLLSLAGDYVPKAVPGTVGAGHRAHTAALDLSKLAGFLPAVIAAPSRETILNGSEVALMSVAASDIVAMTETLPETMARTSEARVPVAGGIATRFVVFRNAIGSVSIAVIVGDPDPRQPIPIRVHSSCVTGDIFASRRCDCGDQLRLAIERIDALGAGAVLYMDQEGRGLGLVNKMRAYELQDRGLDTVDANTALGYHEDERDYRAAARMLADLGWSKVVLLTNNPSKVAALRAAGVDVTDRIPVLAPVNADNRRYLSAKASRAGHLLGELSRSGLLGEA